MIETQTLIEIISGRRQGILPSLIRFGLGLLTPIYRLMIGLRNRNFDRALEFERTHQNQTTVKSVSVPVISIGNLTTGGTGKTPLVIWIARYLRSKKRRVTIVSRGYGMNKNDPSASRNDEAIEMELRLPDVPHLQDPDRHRMATIAVEELESEIILLDDGFQHRQLNRDLDIVLIDATNPFGYGRLLPRGLLREPISSLKRADVLVLTRCNLVERSKLDEIQNRLQTELEPDAVDLPICMTQATPQQWLQFDGQQFPLSHLIGESLFMFCGIGNPDGFARTLESIEVSPAGSKAFPDHHPFSRDDLESIAAAAKREGAKSLVCTHKDLVKVGCNRIGGLPVYALLIEIEFLSGEDEIQELISELKR